MARYEAVVQAAEETERRLATFKRMIAQKERECRGRRFVVHLPRKAASTPAPTLKSGEVRS